jgi:hypothetical protein
MKKTEALKILWHKCCIAIDLAVKGEFQAGVDAGGPFPRYLRLILHTSDKEDKGKSG